MKRKALAVAVGALFIAPAAQAQITFGNDQIGTVQLYGKLYPQFGYSTSKDATATGTAVSTLASPTTGLCGTATSAGGCSGTTPGPRRAVDVQNSYIGFRGERVLGSTGLKGIWQIETAVNFDNPDATVFSSGGTNAIWSTRNSFLGLNTRFGTVKLGNMDTIYKEYGDPFQMFGISSGNFVSASNMLSHIGVGRDNTARFHERKANSIQYETPQFRGFTAGFQYSPDEARGEAKSTLSNSSGTLTTKAPVGSDSSLYSYGVKFDSQSWYLSVHQERHNDFFGGSNNVSSTITNKDTAGAHSRDTGTRFSAEWRYVENQRVTFDISRLKYTESTPAAGVRFQEYQHNTWALGWDGGFGGPWRFATQYVRAGEGSCKLSAGASCSTTGLTGWMLSAGARYRFDRQTFVYLIAGKLNNGPSARYDNWAPADPSRGADVYNVASGVSYTF
jgi:major outer membrane protein P.IB